MGFLDFLKKDKPAPVTAQPLPDAALTPITPPAAAPPPLNIPDTFYEPPVPIPSPTDTPSFSGQQDPSIWASDTSAPPAAPPAKSAFLDSPDINEAIKAASPPAPPASAAETVGPAVVSNTPASAPTSASELPDFSDEEIAELEWILAPRSAKQPAPAKPASIDRPLPVLSPTVKVTTETQVVAAPANAVAIPSDALVLPTGEETTVAELESAKFISSQSYFAILAETKAIRRNLRQNDEVIKEATLRHEQLDQQCKRVAADTNALQESLIKIDEALFED